MWTRWLRTTVRRTASLTRHDIMHTSAVREIPEPSTGPKKLFTPGPLCVSMTTKQAMLQDLGSRDTKMIRTISEIRQQILALAGVSSEKYSCVPMQGSGTFCVEAVLSTVIPKSTGKVLILENGSYGKRQCKICDALNIEYELVSFPENQQVDPATVRKLLEGSDSYHMVSIVHCETSTGVLNPIVEIGEVINKTRPGLPFFVDAMSSFGAIPIDFHNSHIDYLVSSSNKCIQGVPGFAFAICNKDHLFQSRGNARSVSLDLLEQCEVLDTSGQFRFTPPTHVLLAFRQAVAELEQEGGVQARANRYKMNKYTLTKGMNELGFQLFLDDDIAAYIITTYNYPQHPNFQFQEFYERLSTKGHVIYPGKVSDADCFRIGNIGDLFPSDMEALIDCIRETCVEMGVPLPITQ